MCYNSVVDIRIHSNTTNLINKLMSRNMTDYQGHRQIVKDKLNEKITVKSRTDHTILKITPEVWHLIFVPM